MFCPPAPLAGSPHSSGQAQTQGVPLCPQWQRARLALRRLAWWNVCPRPACSQLTGLAFAGPVGKESAESLFVKELKRRGLNSNQPSTADEAPSSAEDIQPLTPPQLAKSRALGAEGLEVQPVPLPLLHANCN